MAKQEVYSAPGLLMKKEKEILAAWTMAQAGISALKKGLTTEKQLRAESAQFLELLAKATGGGNFEDITTPEYDEVIKFLTNISFSRAVLGCSPSDTATYIFSLKTIIIRLLQEEFGAQPQTLYQALMAYSLLLDKLGLITFEMYLKGREEVIQEQQKSMLELSTPVIQVWDEILVLPLIGTIDSARAKQIMESLLAGIVATKSSMIILDITGVPAVDTEVANRLLRTMQAAKLMGAECILTGLSPQISQTMVHLDIDLAGVNTRAVFQDGLELAFRKLKLKLTSTEG